MLSFMINDAPATAPHRQTTRAGVARVFNGYDVPGVATVHAWPHRGMTHARQIARRIHSDPEAYLWAAQAFGVPGIDVTPATAAKTPPRRIRVTAA